MGKKKKYVYLEFSINTITLGKVYFELYNDEGIEKSIENFLSLCKGNEYHSIYSNEMLTYKNCKIEKIKKNKSIKCGYLRNKAHSGNKNNNFECISNNLSTNGNKYEKIECIYGKTYNKEYSQRKHLNAGLLTVVEVGKKKYSSIFKITLNKIKKYDNKNIIIGRVIKNMHIIRAIELLPVNNIYQPKVNIYISDCNEIHESFFKGEKISNRQSYINSLFDNFYEKNKNENEIDDEFNVENEVPIYDSLNIKDRDIKNKVTEKQKGIELLNKILDTIEFVSKNKEKELSQGIAKINEREEGKDESQSRNISQKYYKIDSNKASKKTFDEIEDKQEPLESYVNLFEKSINKEMTERERKLLEIQLKINQSKSLNEMENIKEKMGHSFTGQRNKYLEYMNYTFEKNKIIANAVPKGITKPMEKENLDPDKKKIPENEQNEQAEERNYVYNTSAIKAYNSISKKKKKKMEAYELDNDINLYKKIKFNFSINRKIYDEKKEIYGKNFYGNNLLIHDNTPCSDKDKNRIIEFCKKQEELRSKLSRKRTNDNEIFKNYINRRNKIYNKKLDRYFNEHTAEIRRNLEKQH
ncbi:peptidyl-prolyl cis-trans isomerase, putative [Plasmodium berghei]|uniref:Peptidyl-prolyl cis-trans isomerase, putative n=2 Tax=Plasmodium berghei TaxID=5821 RepID=A0A509ANX5_PLABA|nr:peptidyl-prolyl cis-trans isomerase, putative [Plasmodium berghei ANKA]CXI79161.1 peptidyl-prolyl cis-trans isomerase, putative [Plasmodium berghei]SCM25268.1 peptidyl-prolyl cis-trans isomerase, putative [Plasmodium berghei]SCN27316.1 peptidyl-prolyl cis-trans isomerase, putative [Plasmodium berghei]SCO61939.1 peptidyl-prolyl cis-trans isomerase, putative [Plasmodium berghei]SCO63741.1 peptidyl-prolyl cis-trans isomerase, putative [Plasmodium berghei]|eukprot:XP_034422950.1 peptidyl-prolyl cis-trans isomerase, putative [Plasmodium berghei ANKA]